MKVGVLTHHWLGNFGANLQALATVKTLEGMGHEPILIDYRVQEIERLYAGMIDPAQLELHEDFARRHLPQSDRCNSYKEVVDVASRLDLDCVLSGSDAVLRLDSKTERDDLVFPNPFWLTWARDAGIGRTGFLAASSMGSNYLREGRSTRKGVAEAIRRLNYCGVRDDWTRLMLRSCSPISGNIEFCPDPVSNFSSVVPPELLPDVGLPKKPYLLVGLYPGMFPEEWQVRLTELAHDMGLITVGLPQPNVPAAGSFDMNVPLPLGPLEWYQWIVSSAGYVGVRFHPVMIAISKGLPVVALDDYDNESILGQRPFHRLRRFRRYLGDLPRRSSKTYDLCRRLGIEAFSVPKRAFETLTPEQVIHMLLMQRERPPTVDLRQGLARQFRDGIQKALGVG